METEEQQVEALREWWKENGRTVIAGIVVGLGSVSGWTLWQGHQERQGEAASVLYQQVVDSASRDDHAGVLEVAATIAADHTDSGYAVLARLVAARSHYLRQDLAGAAAQLRWVVDNAARVPLADIARLRLARILAEQGDQPGARALLDAISTPNLGSVVQEARGDIAVMSGETGAARSAYESGLTDASVTPAGRERLRMKLDDLGVAEEASRG